MSQYVCKGLYWCERVLQASGSTGCDLEAFMKKYQPEIHRKIADWFRLENIVTRVSCEAKSVVAEHASRTGGVWPLAWFRETSSLLPHLQRTSASKRFSSPIVQLLAA